MDLFFFGCLWFVHARKGTNWKKSGKQAYVAELVVGIGTRKMQRTDFDPFTSKQLTKKGASSHYMWAETTHYRSRKLRLFFLKNLPPCPPL